MYMLVALMFIISIHPFQLQPWRFFCLFYTFTSKPDWVPTSLLLPPQVVLTSVIGNFILQLSTSPKLSSFCLKLYIHLLNPTCSTFTQLSKPSSASQLTFLLLPLPPNRLFLSQRPVMLWDGSQILLLPCSALPVTPRFIHRPCGGPTRHPFTFSSFPFPDPWNLKWSHLLLNPPRSSFLNISSLPLALSIICFPSLSYFPP